MTTKEAVTILIQEVGAWVDSELIETDPEYTQLKLAIRQGTKFIRQAIREDGLHKVYKGKLISK